MDRIVDEEIGPLASAQLMRMSSPVHLLRCVTAEGEAGPVAISISHRGKVQPDPGGVEDFESSYLRSVAGFLRPGVADIKVVDACREATDPRCLSGIWIGLGRARAEPACVNHIAR